MKSAETTTNWGALVVAGVLLLAGLGCDNQRENPYRPSGSLRQQWSAEGDRIAIYDAEDDVAFKLRRRARGLKVYDRELAPVGFVGFEWDGAAEGEADAESETPSEEAVRIRPLGATEYQRIEPDNGETWRLGDRLRIDRTADGWAVFGNEGEWAGRFFRDEEGAWRLSTDRADADAWRVVEDGDVDVVKRGDETTLRAPAGAVSETTLLALTLDGLPVLERVAVGRWIATRP